MRHIAKYIIIAFIFVAKNDYGQRKQSDVGDANIHGEVYTSGGFPLGNATVQVQDIYQKRVQWYTKSGADGKIRIEGVKAGRYYLNISYPGAYDHPLAITVDENKGCDIGKQYMMHYPNEEDIILEKKDDMVGGKENAKRYIDDRFMEIGGFKVLNVCDYIKMRAVQPLVYVQGVVVIGEIIQSDEGSWLHQKCSDNNIIAGYSLPNAIFIENSINYKKSMRDENILEQIIKYADKNNAFLIANGQRAAVLGNLHTMDNIALSACGNGGVCAFGYGPISAPAKIIARSMRRF
jgi:hypothetical protein